MSRIELFGVEVVTVQGSKFVNMEKRELEKLKQWSIDLPSSSIEIKTRFVDLEKNPYQARAEDTMIIGPDNFCYILIRGTPIFAMPQSIKVEPSAVENNSSNNPTNHVSRNEQVIS